MFKNYLCCHIAGQIAQKVGHLMAHEGNPVRFSVAVLDTTSPTQLLGHPVKLQGGGSESELEHEIQNSGVLSKRLLSEDNVDGPRSEVGKRETRDAKALVRGRQVEIEGEQPSQGVLTAGDSAIEDPVQGGGREHSWGRTPH